MQQGMDTLSMDLGYTISAEHTERHVLYNYIGLSNHGNSLTFIDSDFKTSMSEISVPTTIQGR